MKSRKQRIIEQKQKRSAHNLKALKKATTYVGTTLLMGTTVFTSMKAKASSVKTSVINKNQVKNNNQENKAQVERPRVASNNQQPQASAQSQKQVKTVGNHSQVQSRAGKAMVAGTSSQSNRQQASVSSKAVSAKPVKPTVRKDKSAVFSQNSSNKVKTSTRANSSSRQAQPQAQLQSSQVKNKAKTQAVKKQAVRKPAVSTSRVGMGGALKLRKTTRKIASSKKVLSRARVSRTQRNHTTSAVEFVTSVKNTALSVAQRYNIYPSLMIAQAGLESAWGNSYLSTNAHNLFGVKWTGKGSYITLPTQEYYGGSYHTVNAKFQRYSSYYGSLMGYANLIANSFPNSTRRKASSPYQAARNLRHGKYGAYATAPNYASTLSRVIKLYNLTRFDNLKPNPRVIKVENYKAPKTIVYKKKVRKVYLKKPAVSKHKSQTYKVKSGDSLWSISQRTGISMETLKKWNNIWDNFIYSGQKLNLYAPRKESKKTKKIQAKGLRHVAGKKKAVAKKTTAVKKQKTNSGHYTVKAGDSLWSIAHRNHLTVYELKQMNKLKKGSIYAGQKLRVKKATAKARKKPAKKQVKSYRVKAGDSLWQIAQKNGVTINQLRALNKLKNNFIYSGQKLRIR